MDNFEEGLKSYRYEKLFESLKEAIENLAENFKEHAERYRLVKEEDGRYREERISEGEIEGMAYDHACEEFLDNLEDNVPSENMYYVFEIMLRDLYGYEPCKRNPYK